jgi:uncharacterized protein (DUF305 family)
MAAPPSDVVRRLAVPAGRLLLVLLGLAGGLWLGPRWTTPRDDSAEAGFARDMATHHAQAVDMAFSVRDNARRRRGPHARAADIIVTQSTQRGIFMDGSSNGSCRRRQRARAWRGCRACHLAAGTGEPVLMHGMASEAELQRLRDAHGIAAEILFLQLMIRHHEGGIIMARA